MLHKHGIDLGDSNNIADGILKKLNVMGGGQGQSSHGARLKGMDSETRNDLNVCQMWYEFLHYASNFFCCLFLIFVLSMAILPVIGGAPE